MNDNLGPQFPENGYVSLNDHKDALNLEHNYGNMGYHPSRMRRTGESVDVTPDMRVTPNQGTVYAAAVHKYIERPNDAPISLWRDSSPETGGAGETYVLEGHHRLVAARLTGRTLRGEFFEHPEAVR